jgi:Immunoglobulin domain
MKLDFLCRLPAITIVTLLAFFALGRNAGAVGTSIVTVNIVGGGTVMPNYNGQSLTNGNRYTMNARANPGFAFAGWVYTNAFGVITNTKAKLVFTNNPVNGLLVFTATFTDKQKPTISISPVPGSSALVTNYLFLGGTARDNAGVAGVFFRLRGDAWQSAGSYNAWSNWWCSVTLAPGINYFDAYAVDTSGLCSKTNSLKLIYTVAPVSLTNTIITATKPGGAVVIFDLGTNTFTETTGVGNFTYKKNSSTSGQLSLAYFAPPSATGKSNNVAVLLQFSDATDGTFTDADGLNTFTLAPANDWASPALNGSTIALSYNDGIHASDLTFQSPPNAVTNLSPVNSNPFTIALDADYPGAPGDLVAVTFAHQHFVSQFNVWVPYPNQSFVGTVIDIGSSSITVQFGTAPKSNKVEQYTLLAGAALQIQTCDVTNFAGGVLVAGGTATFNYTNPSPDGALLQLSQSGTNQFITLLFTNNSSAGIFYEEDYAGPGTTPFATASGSFGITLPPQITAQPQSVAEVSNAPVIFSVTAKGSPPLYYQWQFNGTNLTDGTPPWSSSTISGSTGNSLTISNPSTNDIGGYSVVITNAYGSVISQTAQLTLTPQITAPPQSVTTTNGGTAQFSVTATGIQPLNYTWQFNGTNIPSGNNPSPWSTALIYNSGTYLSLTGVSANDQGNYQVIVGNNYGSVTSSVVTLTISAATTPPTP